MNTEELNLGELLHVNTKNRPATAVGVPLEMPMTAEWLALQLADESVKEYPTRPHVPLPPARGTLAVDLAEAIRLRESGRRFSHRPLNLADLATLLWLTGGIRAVDQENGWRDYRRNAPTAGNLGSVSLYPVLRQVDSVPAGLYHYDGLHHRLDRLNDPDPNAVLTEGLLQPELAAAPAVVVFGSALSRVMGKYGERGYRYAHLDAGHAAQNLCLVAAALGLAACCIGGYCEDPLNRALGLDGLDESVLYAVALGWPE